MMTADEHVCCRCVSVCPCMSVSYCGVCCVAVTGGQVRGSTLNAATCVVSDFKPRAGTTRLLADLTVTEAVEITTDWYAPVAGDIRVIGAQVSGETAVLRIHEAYLRIYFTANFSTLALDK
jgi:hypothetical protein